MSAAIREHFEALANVLTANTRGDEISLCSLHAEATDFARFNHAAIRQAGTVEQRTLSITLVRGRTHCSSSLALTGVLADDRDATLRALGNCRDQLPLLPEDPHLLIATEVRSTEQETPDRLPADRLSIVADILALARGQDFVGISAAGSQYSGFANSLGQRNWFATHTFNVDWSLVLQADKAVKCAYAGFEWDRSVFQRKIAAAEQELAILARPARTIEPGKVRAYLAPAALAELIGLLNWGGFGLKSHCTKQTPLLAMVEGGARLDQRVTLREDTAQGIAPNFQGAGFVKPDAVTLIERGAYRDCLASPRSAKEYGVATNGADASEMPHSIDMAAGDLSSQDVLARLDTGVYVNNLWYLNYSDRAAGRITGMTRFATFWVENGEIRAPLNVMRFDDTLFDLLGANLEALTRERELLIDNGTYGARSTDSARLPGALLRAITFTL